MLADHHHAGHPMLNHGSCVDPTVAYYFSCKCICVSSCLSHAVLVTSGGTFLYRHSIEEAEPRGSKDPCYLSRGPRFSSHHSHGNAQPSVTPGESNALFWPLQVPGTHMIYRHKCMQNTHMHIFLKNDFKEPSRLARAT